MSDSLIKSINSSVKKRNLLSKKMSFLWYDENDGFDIKLPLLSGTEDIASIYSLDTSQDEQEVLDSGIFIEYLTFPDVVDKVQKRSKKLPDDEEKNYSQQRLNSQQALVRIRLNVLCGGQPHLFKVFVQRLPEAARRLKEDPVLVPIQPYDWEQIGPSYEFSVNLDSVYTYNNKLVYKLAKNQTDEVNKFRLVIQVCFVDSTWLETCTKSFLIKGRAQKNSSDPSSSGGCETGSKRARTDTEDSFESGTFFDSESVISPPGVRTNSVSSTEEPPTTNFNTFHSIETKRIEAQIAKIDDLTVSHSLSTPKGDIAYHFVLMDPYSHPEFLKGEVVGFFMDKLGKTVINKLTAENYNEAFLKGVITRNQYIEAKKPNTDDVRTETICMMGIVPVQVQGTVHQGEMLIASSSVPGVAISEYSVYNDGNTNWNGAIGYALQTSKCMDDEEIHLVECYISIMVGFQKSVIDKKVKELHGSFDVVERKRKEDKRRRRCGYLLAFVFMVLLGIFLWQFFAPGTALRYFVCKRGSIKGSTASFTFVPIRNIFVRHIVHGIEFDFYKLEKKKKFRYRPMKLKGVKYYLNLDRCAHGGLRTNADKQRGFKTVYGPNVFTVTGDCNGTVWYYYDRLHKWQRYLSAKDLKCS